MHVTVGSRTLLAKTCHICGKFKQVKDFSLVRVEGRQYRNSYCHRCNNDVARPGLRKHQQEASDAAVKHGQPWSEQDIERLLEMAERGLSGPQMAMSLNRTVYSVYTMKNKLSKEI